MLRIILLILSLLSLSSYQVARADDTFRKKIKDFTISADTTRLAVEDQFRIGIWALLDNGKVKGTAGLNRGWLSWRWFDIQVENGYFRRGSIYFNRSVVLEQDPTIRFTVTVKDRPHLTKSFSVSVPHLVSFSVGYTGTQRLTPGDQVPLVLDAHFSNGQNYLIPDVQRSRLINPKDFMVDMLGKPYPLDELHIPYHYCEPRSFVPIRVQWIYQPQLCADLNLPISYQAHYSEYFQGRDGSDGSDGSDSCTDGSDGSDGSDGQSGEDGDDVAVYVLPVQYDGKTFLRVRVSTRHAKRHYLLSAEKGQLEINARGGDGGEGGDGGDGYEADSVQHSNDGGDGGDGGPGGDGGRVTFHTTVDGEAYLSAFHVYNSGGDGGDSGDEGDEGTNGSDGSDGSDGRDGWSGGAPHVLLVDERVLQQYFADCYK